MTTIDRIMAKVAKLRFSLKTRNHLASLVQQAYEAGRQDAIKDIYTDLYSELSEVNHLPALQLIDANY